MHDRVVDRAAPHATRAELQVRDWLLVALSFSTGIYEAICFLTFGKVFSAAQTGNLVLLGVGAYGTPEPAGPNAVTVVIALASFAVGAALAIPILKAFDGDKEIQDQDNDVFHVWPRRVTIVLAVTLVLQAVFLGIWMTASSPASLAYVLITFSALAMGLQMNAIRSLHVPGVSVTAFTATFIGLISGLTTWSRNSRSMWRLALNVIALPAGALLGDFMLSHIYRSAPAVPLFVIAVVIVVAWVALKPPVRSGPAAPKSVPTQRTMKLEQRTVNPAQQTQNPAQGTAN